jgi:hypothetical protein
VIVKNPWTKKRIFSEFRRDRARLLKKAYEKMILGDTRYHEDDPETILSKARQANLTASDLESLSKECGYKYSLVNDHNDRESENILEKSRPDIIVFTGGGMIRKNILSIPNIGILNCHSGILPRFRGMDVLKELVSQYISWIRDWTPARFCYKKNSLYERMILFYPSE